MCCFPVVSATPAPEIAGRRDGKVGKAAGRAAKSAAKAKPVVSGGDSPHTETLKARLAELRASGFNRLWQQGKIVEFSTPESLLDLDFTLPVFVLLDRIVVSAENRSRIVDAVETAYREAGEVIFEEAPREETAERRRLALLRRVRVQELPPAGERAGAAPLQLQQSLWRLPALPGLRQHGGLRPEPGDSRQGAEPCRWRDRSVEPAQVQALVQRTAQAGAGAGRAARRAVARPA